MGRKWSIEEIVFLHFFDKRRLKHKLQAKILKRTIRAIEHKRRKLNLTKRVIFNEMSYICKNKSGSYSIRKWLNRKYNHFGTFKKLKYAKEERDLLIKYNWDLEKVCECHNETANNLIIFNNHAVAEVS